MSIRLDNLTESERAVVLEARAHYLRVLMLVDKNLMKNLKSAHNKDDMAAGFMELEEMVQQQIADEDTEQGMQELREVNDAFDKLLAKNGVTSDSVTTHAFDYFNAGWRACRERA